MTITDKAGGLGEEGFEIPRRYFAAAAILIGVLMSALDSSIVPEFNT